MQHGVLYRQVNEPGRADYDHLVRSGLYADLVATGDLVPHEDVDRALSPDGRACRVIRPEPVAFISYPYEWCFSQLKDAALLTLRLQKAAVARGMSLKDATAYNVQFEGARPVFIDVPSLEMKREAARGRCHVDVGFWGGIVPGNEQQIAPLIAAGVRGFKCFLTPSGVDEFPSVSERDLRRSLPVLARSSERPTTGRTVIGAGHDSPRTPTSMTLPRAAVDAIRRPTTERPSVGSSRATAAPVPA